MQTNKNTTACKRDTASRDNYNQLKGLQQALVPAGVFEIIGSKERHAEQKENVKGCYLMFILSTLLWIVRCVPLRIPVPGRRSLMSTT